MTRLRASRRYSNRFRAARAILANDPADNDARFIGADAAQRLNTTDPPFEPPILKRYDEERDAWLNSPAGPLTAFGRGT
ncbi:MAG: hypothetical protein CHACPFDD_03289 [Phycisphaerae bacterium]|nr:hypothetical protein [Phycisphaerae bacterium]